MEKKKWFVSYVIKPKGENHVTTHAFIEGDNVRRRLKPLCLKPKKACRWKLKS
ncbi:hypothetical protein AB9Q52_017375 [Pantoea vagans]|uniref:hypothetical protein n=1 Tax=Pantoea vagans TaxID=470934 RepID=UPI003515DBA1